MKRNKFRFIAALLVAISLMSIPAYAEKIYFTITTPGDTYSRKAWQKQMRSRHFM